MRRFLLLSVLLMAAFQCCPIDACVDEWMMFPYFCLLHSYSYVLWLVLTHICLCECYSDVDKLMKFPYVDMCLLKILNFPEI